MTTLQMAVLALALTGAGEGQTVLLDFSAPWCGPCRQMDPVVRRLEEKGYPVRRVDFDRDRALANRFGVTRIPCFVMLVDGREVGRTLGLAPAAELERLCRLGQKHPATSQPDVPAILVSMPSEPAATIAIPSRQSVAPLPLDTADAATPALLHNLHAGGNGVAAAASPRPAVSDADLLAATVRLRVRDPQGTSLGTGTIIDARNGMALILTCGHIFRDFRGKGLEVDLFGPEPVEGIPGQVLSYDEKRDVGLIAIRTPGPVKTAQVAPRGYAIAIGDAVSNVGCNHGDDPTVRHNRVCAIDKYLGPPNIEVGGLPVQGRSGGGLFCKAGYVIGVCNAADPQDNEGIYAAVASIRAQIGAANLTYVLNETNETNHDLIAQAPLEPVDSIRMAREMPAPANIIQQTTTDGPMPATTSPIQAAGFEQPAALSPEEQAALSEIRRRQAQGAEVICIIRSRSDPNAASEVLVLDSVSPEFLRRLASGQPGG